MDLDWCTYALECLNTGRKSWDFTKKDTFFTGPLLFLLVLYVSSIIVPGETVERRFPLMNCWTTETLKMREAKEVKDGGFGKLKIANGVVLVDNNIHDEVLIHTVEEALESEDMAHCSGHNEALEFISESTLSQYPSEQPINLSKTKSKNIIVGKSLHPTESPPQSPPHLMPIPNPYADKTNNPKYTKTQLSESQKQLDDMMLIVSNLQKHMDQQAFEANRRVKETELLEQEQENLAQEKELRKQERENLAREREFLEKERGNLAQEKEIRNQERENLARERELLEQEQENLVQEKEIRKQEREILARERELLEQERENLAQEREKLAAESEKWAEILAHAMTNNLQNLINKQSEEHQKMIMIVNKMQKNMESQALVAECREQKQEKQEEEREKRADIRAHAIIWDIETQR